MEINLRTSTIYEMLNIISKIKNNTVSNNEIEEILNNPDYQMEFARYEGRVSKEEYVEYLLRFLKLQETDIQNEDLKAHHKYYIDLANNLEFYKNQLINLEIPQNILDQQATVALNGLPQEIKMDKINAISTIGIGQSFGYVFNDNIHFDFLQLVKEHSMADLAATIAHEIHHVGLNTLFTDEFLNELSLESLFYIYFSGEGLAVKYCNNAKGNLSKSIYEGPSNIGLDPYTWNYLNNDFDNTMKHFKENIKDIRSGKINTSDSLQKELIEYWMNPFIEGQSKNEIPKLKHFRLYSFGNEIWGIIHDCFGKEKVFEVINNPELFPTYYNKSLELLDKKEYQI